MKKWKSCAQWPGGSLNLARADNVTQDKHETEAEAHAACRMLENDGLGGAGQIFPIKTWVEPVTQNVKMTVPALNFDRVQARFQDTVD